MIRLSTLFFFTGVTLGSPSHAADPSTPNPKLTPGSVASHNLAEVCAKDARGQYTYSRMHRVWHDKAGTLAKYGIPRSQGNLYEDDDRVPLCAGGDNADPRNHWPMRWSDAELKDELEREVCVRVCNWRTMSLDVAQRLFLGDWREGYREIFGRTP
jgi:hypothetical protein